MRVFIGYDPRQPLAYNVLQHSIVKNASKPVSITPLILSQLPLTRRGLTEFTYSRYLVPWLCGYEGRALFLDADMVVKGDVTELFAAGDDSAVQINQEQPKFEWASAMLFNCDKCRLLTPEYVNDPAHKLFDLAFGTVGKFPKEWNYCVGYTETPGAKLYHYTQGIPCWYETQGLEDETWLTARDEMLHTVTWKELMGMSVHAQPTLQRLFNRLKPSLPQQ